MLTKCKADNTLKLPKRLIIPLLSALLLLLSSCTQKTPDVLESIINNIDNTTVDAIVDSGRYKDYRELYLQYKEQNSAFFVNTEAAINSLLGQKYAYGITAYKHSDELAEIIEMFFDDNAENTLNIYFALRGFEDKVYQQSDNTAEYSCKKKDESYLYKASYDAENNTFGITLEVNGELKDSFRCTLTDDSLTKYCYRGTLDRTFISCVNKDGTSQIDWYEGYTEDGTDVAEDDHGYIVFDGIALSGVIK